MSAINIFNKYYNIDYIFYMSAIDIFKKYYNIEYSILCQLLIYLLNTIPLSIYTICSHLYTLYMILVYHQSILKAYRIYQGNSHRC